MALSNGSASRRSSLSKTPLQQQQQQRSIASFFAPTPPSSSAPHRQKPRLVVSASAEKTVSEGSTPASIVSPLTSEFKNSKKALHSQESASSHEESLPVPSSADISNPSSVLGKRIRVYWPLDDAWYEGIVKEYASPNHVIQYDDGEEEAICLKTERFELVSCDKAPRRRKLRKLSFLKASFDRVSNELAEDGLQGEDDEQEQINIKTTVSVKKGRGLAIASNSTNEAYNTGDNDHTKSSEDGDDLTKSSENGDDSADDEWTIESSAKAEDEDILFEVAPDDIGRSKQSRSNVKQKQTFSKSKKRSQTCKSGRSGAQKNSSPQGASPVNASLTTEHTHSTHQQTSYMNSATCTHLSGEAAERFGPRAAEKLFFLEKDRKDASGRQPGDVQYDPCTLFLPPEFKKGLAAGQRQWWELKSKHMDKVMLFKMGKFYEMFEMDAHIGAQVLDLQYMKGNQPHCGFPEKNFEENAGKLARTGYRVLVVEQVETPGQLEERNLKAGTKDKVVKREVCGVITKGTITEAEMLACSPDAAYLMAIFELSREDKHDRPSTIGLCVLDAATSRFMVGQWSDNLSRSRLRSILSELRPVELVKPVGLLSQETEKALMEEARNPLVTSLIPDLEFWDAERTIRELALMFGGSSENFKICDKADYEEGVSAFPEFLQSLVRVGDKAKALLSALGGCLSYLRKALLDCRLVNSGRFELLPGSDSFLDGALNSNSSLKNLMSSNLVDNQEPYMMLDSSSLENLDILENSHDGSSKGTLLEQLDYCVTAFGRRRLRQWIVRPLLRVDAIIDRQNAIEDLKGIADEAVEKFRKELMRLPDMERLVVRLKSCNEKTGRNANAVVLYEDAAKKLLKEFLNALRGFQTVREVLTSFARLSGQFRSERLKSLLNQEKGVQEVASALTYFEDAFDWLNAEKNGRITPHNGVDKEFDLRSENVHAIQKRLDTYLEEQRNYFKCQSIAFVTVGKDRYQLEIPDSLQAKVPHNYNVESQKKGVRRYSTPEVKQLLAELVLEEECKEAALKNILQGLLVHFCKDYTLWLSIIQSIAELDALISLTLASNAVVGVTCKPTLRSLNDHSGRAASYIFAKDLRHPILERSLESGRFFVPNDIKLGGEDHGPFMLLTGPNMGGKSTLIRQVCLAVILAQIGAYVPASEFYSSPIDQIFVRMGAKDHIMSAQSTFLVELLETSSMLTSATRHSLVALDELGRGTSTSDGQAIAHAVLEHLVHKVGCLGMFSTHYHCLADEHANDSEVALYHMACKVANDNAVEKVTFLYKLASGACPKSYGVNVARIAGMPESVLKRAATRAAELQNLESQNTMQEREQRLLVDILQLATNADIKGINTVLDLHKQSISVLCRQLSRPQNSNPGD